MHVPLLALAVIRMLLGYGRAAFNLALASRRAPITSNRTHMNRRRKLATSVGLGLLVVSALPMGSQPVDAADHRDAPGTQADPFADLNDLYAWHTEDGTIVVVVTFNGLLAPDTAPEDIYNPDELPNVLYTVHIDNDSAPLASPGDWDSQDGDTYDSEIDIHVKFGQNGLGEWGVQVENLPGADAAVVGPVDTAIDGGNGTSVQAGLFDDPFFFDLDGFLLTLSNLDDDTPATEADIGFASLQPKTLGMPHDSFAGTNTMAIVLEFPADAALGGNADNYIQVWATSGRAP